MHGLSRGRFNKHGIRHHTGKVRPNIEELSGTVLLILCQEAVGRLFRRRAILVSNLNIIWNGCVALGALALHRPHSTHRHGAACGGAGAARVEQ